MRRLSLVRKHKGPEVKDTEGANILIYLMGSLALGFKSHVDGATAWIPELVAMWPLPDVWRWILMDPGAGLEGQKADG